MKIINMGVYLVKARRPRRRGAARPRRTRADIRTTGARRGRARTSRYYRNSAPAGG